MMHKKAKNYDKGHLIFNRQDEEVALKSASRKNDSMAKKPIPYKVSNSSVIANAT